MSGRDLVDEMRSGARPLAEKPRGGGIFDIVIGAVAVVALGALGYVAYGTWFSGKAPRPPVQVAAVVMPAEPVVWTEDDTKACAAKANAAAENADTGTYLITNPSLAEGIPFLVTRVECQLTVKEVRFCGPEGNAKLVAIVDDYLNRMDVIRVGIAAQGAPMAILGGMMGGEISAGDEIYGSMAEDTLKFMSEHHARVVAALRALAKEGVVTADAFKPFPFAGVPSRIQPIFAGIEAKSNLCA